MSDNESLHFVSSIDLQTLRADVAKIEQSLRGITSTAHAEARKFDDTYKKLTQVVAGYFTLAFGAQLAGNVATVTGEFQKYEAVLTNSLGSSKEAADSMRMIAEFAAATPFSLAELTGSYVKLVNQGFKPTREEMTKMADLSASVGKDFGMLTEAIIDAQTGEFERLKEFGIRASKEGDKVTFSFKGVETQVGFTAKNIQSYILSLGELNGVAGSTAAISKTIEGQISNLGDAIGQMYADLGQDNEGLISGTLSGITSLVQNYETVLKVLESMVVAYGAYRTAVIISSLTMKGLTIAENLHLIALMAKEYALKAVTAAQLMFNKAAMMNPLGLILGSLVAVTGALLIFGNKTKEVSLAQESSARASENAATAFAKQKGSVDLLLKSIHDQTLTEKQRLDAINKLKETIPGYNAELSKEGKLINENTQAIKDYLEQLEIQMLQQAIQSELQDLVTKRIVATRELTKATKDYNKELAAKKEIEKLGYTQTSSFGSTGNIAVESLVARKEAAKNEAKRNLEEVNAAIVSLEGEFSQASQDIAQLLSKSKVTKTVINGKYWQDQAKEAQEAIMLLDTASATYASDRAKQLAIISKAEAELIKIRGQKNNTKEKDEVKERLEALKDELDEKKRLYGDDLFAYRSYLKAKMEEVGKNKDEASVVQKATVEVDADIDSKFKQLLSDYATYEDKRQTITKKYSEAWINLTAKGYDNQAEEAKKQMDKELNELDSNHVKETASYQYLFENIDKLSVDSLKRRIERLKQDLAFTATTAEERLAIEKALAEASDALITKAPMAALKQLDARAKELRVKINAAKNDAERAPLQAELDGVTQKQGAALSTVFSDVSSRLSEAKELAGLFGDELADAVSTASQLAGAFAQIASGNYVGGAIALVTTLATAQSKWNAQQKAKEEKESQERVAASNELIAEANKLYSEQLDLLGRIRGVNTYGQIDASKEALIASLTEANAAVEALSLKDKNQHYTTKEWKRTGWASVGYSTTNRWHDYNMSELNSSLASAINDPTFDKVKAAKAEIEKIKALMKDGTIFGDTKALEAQLDNYNELLKKAEELALKEAEIYTGSTYDSMVEAIASGFEDGTYTAEEFAKNFEDLMKKAILNALKIKWIEEPMKQWNAHFAEAMKDGVLSEEEAAALKAEMQGIKDSAAAGLAAINQAGIDLLGDSGSKAEGLSGAIKGMSQESADLMAGQLGAMRIHLADIAAAMTGTFNSDLKSAWQTPTDMLSSTLGTGIASINDNLALMKETGIRANDILMSIELNTRQIADVKNVLIDIKNSGSLKGYSEGFKDDRISGR